MLQAPEKGRLVFEEDFPRSQRYMYLVNLMVAATTIIIGIFWLLLPPFVYVGGGNGQILYLIVLIAVPLLMFIIAYIFLTKSSCPLQFRIYENGFTRNKGSFLQSYRCEEQFVPWDRLKSASWKIVDNNKTGVLVLHYDIGDRIWFYINDRSDPKILDVLKKHIPSEKMDKTLKEMIHAGP